MALRDVLLEAALPPVSILLLLLLAVLLLRRARLSRNLLVAATLLFLLLSLPAVGELLTRPLAGAGERFDPSGGTAGIAAVMVATGGAYQDAAGNWWPGEITARRAARGLVLARDLGLPLILAGGNPVEGAPSEARVLAATMDFDVPDVRIEPTARDSAETGAAVAALLEGQPARVILVTSDTHVARMAASLRRHGVAVLLPPAAPGRSWSLGDFLPRSEGLGRSRAALYEYVGLFWYLVSGRITPGDLDY